MRATHGTSWQRLPSSALNGEIKTRIDSYKSNLDKAVETDSTVESNMVTIKPKIAYLQLSRNELTQKMPKSQESEAASSPAVTNIQQTIEQLNELKRERQTTINHMTAGLESADLRKDLMSVHSGTKSKDSVFETHLQGINGYSKVIEDQQIKSSELLSVIDTNMMSFNQTLAGSSDTSKIEFFKSIDEGLKLYYENMNLLSNGSKFYKQMHTYLTSLHLYVNDFVASRTVEKDQIIEQLNAGAGPPPGAPGSTGSPYNPSFIPQNPYGGGHYQ
uniref:ALIX V-shaped domain-containing protein n=1 Tax=Euplotes crassus TaxID=5936 RepID=A0A7S3NZ69_EUPCR|mmetsp:Transcript_35093/g.34761  ORF Transcript_35093/g.34761 Transcript_35093/m.34761 type:complete len:274 (+) Transcript_35093:1213-2034(+)